MKHVFVCASVCGILAIVSLWFTSGAPWQPSSAVVPRKDTPRSEVAAKVDARDQYALLAALRTLRKLPAESRAPAYEEIHRAWSGRTYEWTMGLVRTLCQEPERCFSLPFDGSVAVESQTQGWLPRLHLDKQTHTRLLGACPAGAAVCVARIRGELVALQLAEDLPVSLQLDHVSVSQVRAARADESWGSGARRPAVASADLLRASPLRAISRSHGAAHHSTNKITVRAKSATGSSR